MAEPRSSVAAASCPVYLGFPSWQQVTVIVILRLCVSFKGQDQAFVFAQIERETFKDSWGLGGLAQVAEHI